MGELPDIVSLGQGDEALADGIGLRRLTHDPHHPVARHAHDFHVVKLILSSPGVVEFHFGEGQNYSGRPSVGDVVIFPAFMPHLLACWERPFESFSVGLSTGLLERVAERAGLGPGGLRRVAIRRDLFVGQVARKLADGASADLRGRAILAEQNGLISFGTLYVLRPKDGVVPSRIVPRCPWDDENGMGTDKERLYPMIMMCQLFQRHAVIHNDI